MPTSLGQSWPQSTISLQSQQKYCLTVTAPFPAGVSSSDEESSSSLLSTFTPEFVARERLAAAKESHREIVSELLASRWPLVCRKAPVGRSESHLHTCPNTSAAALGTGKCFAPPPHPSLHHQDKEPAKIRIFPRAAL